MLRLIPALSLNSESQLLKFKLQYVKIDTLKSIINIDDFELFKLQYVKIDT